MPERVVLLMSDSSRPTAMLDGEGKANREVTGLPQQDAWDAANAVMNEVDNITYRIVVSCHCM